MIYFCCDEERRRALIENLPYREVNGIDFLEVTEDQLHLIVHFITDSGVSSLTEANIVIEGGERIQVKAIDVHPGSIPDPKVIVVDVDGPGDFSVYTFRLVRGGSGNDSGEPPQSFDPLLSETDFEFKVLCESDFDCKTKQSCTKKPERAPVIDYLAKDYASFRQLMLDRMAVLVPEWKERHAADLGVTLVELLAYVGDYLSYKQDAIATEAYLGTARSRVSIRRHVRLVDYAMHEGTNARVWVALRVNQQLTLPVEDAKGRTQFLTRTSVAGATLPTRLGHDSQTYRDALASGVKVFELVDAAELLTLRLEHNEMQFHTWGALECCLPRGATTADLVGDLRHLKNTVVIFAEVLGPRTGDARDADRAHRHAVRITDVKVMFDPVAKTAVTRVTWDAADALPSPVCISAKLERGVQENISVAWGNVVLADHGMTRSEQPIGTVPALNPALAIAEEHDQCEVLDDEDEARQLRFRPALPDRDITFASPYTPGPASASLELAPRQLAPLGMQLAEVNGAKIWTPQADLLNASSSDTYFVVETENDGSARIRFGDGVAGRRPESPTEFVATYRVGNGSAGNIGGDVITTIVSDAPAVVVNPPVIEAVTNPLPARGGVDRESIERVRQNAPEAFRTQERAVTAADYASMAQRCDKDVQRAAATFRWTGSWYTVFVTVDRKGGRIVDPKFAENMQRCLERYRMAGHDLEFDKPRFVPLEIALGVCVKRDYFVSDVEGAVRDVIGSFFDPDRFTFGQSLYLSSLVAAVQAVEGVDSVELTKFQRQGEEKSTAIDDGFIPTGHLEIVQMENDPSHRERGVVTLTMRGGR